MIALTRPGPEEAWGQDLWVLQAPILEDSSAEEIDNAFETEVRSECLRRTRLRGTIKSNLRRNQSLKRSQDARLLSQAWIWEKFVFLIQITWKKPFPGSRPLCTRRLHSDWPWQESMAWQTNNQPGPGSSITLSPWHGVGNTVPHLGLSFWFRTCHGSCTKLQCGARIQGFLATGLAPVAKPVNLISERLRKAKKATGWLRG